MSHFKFLPACLMALAGLAAHADEIARFKADLDGDGKSETIRLSVSPGVDEAHSLLTVAIGGGRFSTQTFDVDGAMPELRVVAIDAKSRLRQVIVETFEADSCRYDIVGYHAGRLVRLLTFDGGPGCEAPNPLGQGVLATRTWAGFWWRTESYRLAADGASLKKVEQTEYDVNVAGAAGVGLVLGGATCETAPIDSGAFVRVTRFDAKLDRYLLEGPGRACGWVPASDLSDIAGKVCNLPYAG